MVDVRQRRGVRGADYAWANFLRLQAALRQAEIRYRHVPELAPTTALRELQYRQDERLKVGKRSRIELSETYRRRYLGEIVDRVDVGAFLECLPDEAVSALLCGERDAQACHRSLIAAQISAQFAVLVTNL